DLDDCIDSLLHQDWTTFEVALIDNGSSSAFQHQILLDDPRFSLTRYDTPLLWEACIGRFLFEACQPDDTIFLLAPHEQLADSSILRKIQHTFQNVDCHLAYGQHRLATGHLGDAEPAPDEATFVQAGAALGSRSAII